MTTPIGSFPIYSDVDVAAVARDPWKFIRRVESYHGEIAKGEDSQLFGKLHYAADMAPLLYQPSRKAIADVIEVDTPFDVALRAVGVNPPGLPHY